MKLNIFKMLYYNAVAICLFTATATGRKCVEARGAHVRMLECVGCLQEFGFQTSLERNEVTSHRVSTSTR